MIINTPAIKNGYFLDKYGKRGDFFKNGMPSLSFPFTIENYPKETKSFALTFLDPDSVPVCGFVFVHWIVANITKNEMEENDKGYTQGKNDYGTHGYGGMAPPNAPHNYELTVYALDDLLPLEEGFTLTDLKNKMKNHILARTKLVGKYAN